jgi:hypothetical protein|tara:strand:- start:289 stop:450 length:162 start_codon:yes stop_codon:yes gene_type:complete
MLPPAASGKPLLVVTELDFPRNILAELPASARKVRLSAGADDVMLTALVPTVV